MRRFRTAAVTALAVLAAALPVLVVTGGAPPAVAQERAVAAPAPLTVICVRHAEKASDSADPELTEEGVARAEALARTLGHAGVTHVFASEFRRTQATVAPLAGALDLEVEVVSAREPQAQVRALEALPAGSVAVVAGHSNTVPGLVSALGGSIAELEQHERYGPMLGDGEYDRLFVVTRFAAGEDEPAVTTLELRYGE